MLYTVIYLLIVESIDEIPLILIILPFDSVKVVLYLSSDDTFRKVHAIVVYQSLRGLSRTFQ